VNGLGLVEPVDVQKVIRIFVAAIGPEIDHAPQVGIDRVLHHHLRARRVIRLEWGGQRGERAPGNPAMNIHAPRVHGHRSDQENAGQNSGGKRTRHYVPLK
jgi:hypothetical protein